MSVVTDFIQSPNLDKLLNLKKDDLLAVGNELNIEVKRSTRKAHIVRSIAKDLIECEDYPEDFNESIWEKNPPDPREIESDNIKLAGIDAEKAIEKARIEAEYKEGAEIKKAKIEAGKELEKARMENKIKGDELRFKHDLEENRRNQFDLTKYVNWCLNLTSQMLINIFSILRKLLKICIGLKMYGLHYFSLRLGVKPRKHMQLYLLMTLLIMML